MGGQLPELIKQSNHPPKTRLSTSKTIFALCCFLVGSREAIHAALVLLEVVEPPLMLITGPVSNLIIYCLPGLFSLGWLLRWRGFGWCLAVWWILLGLFSVWIFLVFATLQYRS